MDSKGSISKSKYNTGSADWNNLFFSKIALEASDIDRDWLKNAGKKLSVQELLLSRWNDLESECSGAFIDVSVHKFFTDPHRGSGSTCLLDVDDFLRKIYSRVEGKNYIEHLVPILSEAKVSKYIGRQERMQAINEELRTLRQELPKKHTKEIFLKIRKLVQELHSIISFFYSEQRKLVRRHRKSLHAVQVRDIRKILRQTVRAIFKNLPDFSGSEEEARFKTIADFKPLFQISNQEINELQQIFFTQCAGHTYALSVKQA